MADIVMPRLSDTMEEGTILRWLGRDGQEIRKGDELVEIETDKATMVYESDQEGILQILAREGETLVVGALIARVGAEPTTAAQDARDAAAAPAADATHADGEHDGAGARAAGAPRGPGPKPGDHAPQPVQHAPQPAPDLGSGRLKASPLARRVAREAGVDLRDVRGSGPGGRIIKADVQAAADRALAAPAASGAEPALASRGAERVSEVLTAKGEAQEVELTRTQQTIARRMAESMATIPHFALEVEVDMEPCATLRAELRRLAPVQAAGEATGGLQAPGAAEAIPTYNDMVVKACALALRAHPRANSSYRDGRLQLHTRVNVGIAVATAANDPAGAALIVPTVFDADAKSLGEIARETRMLAARVRDGSITPPQLGGGTFTVSNLGMFAVRRFTAIINPPQAAILSVGAVRHAAVVHEGQLAARHVMSPTLACDHRILYGADAAAFLAQIRELLEQPTALAL